MGRTRKPQQSRSQRTVDAIVSAGFIEAARGGMEGVTTRRIADTAGVGVGSVYEYFENKEAIVTAMNQRMVDELVGRLPPATRKILLNLLNKADPSWEDRLSRTRQGSVERTLINASVPLK